MSETSPITGELSNSKVAAVFSNEPAARAAAQAVATTLSLGSAQVQVITPADPHPGRKLEPESRGIWRTIVVAHVRLGIVGVVVGLLTFAALYAAGLPFIVNSPVAAALALLFFGAVAGLMLGGLVALRPDHDRYVEAARDAMESGNTTVVVHAFSGEQADQAADLLRAQGGEVTSTL
jgi:VIT1/CCC1 family predicted Fe2+/Mn2+ transporter